MRWRPTSTPRLSTSAPRRPMAKDDSGAIGTPAPKGTVVSLPGGPCAISSCLLTASGHCSRLPRASTRDRDLCAQLLSRLKRDFDSLEYEINEVSYLWTEPGYRPAVALRPWAKKCTDQHPSAPVVEPGSYLLASLHDPDPSAP
jgi:hypothetical protein